MHFQHTVKVVLDKNRKEIRFKFSEKDFYNLIKNNAMGFDINNINQVKYNFYPGTHIRAMISDKQEIHENIITAFLPEDAILSPYHHSFLKIVNIHNKIRLRLTHPI